MLAGGREILHIPCNVVSGKNPAASLIWIPCRSTVLILWFHGNLLIDIIQSHKIYLNVFVPMYYDKIKKKKKLFQKIICTFRPGEVSTNVPWKSHSLEFALFSFCNILLVVFLPFKWIYVASSVPEHSLALCSAVFSPPNKFLQLPLLSSLLKFLLNKNYFYFLDIFHILW